MPLSALAVALGALLAYFGNQLPDPLWSAYAPLALALALLRPGQRFFLLLCAAYLWSAALLHYHLDQRLPPAQDNRIHLLRGTIADLPEIEDGLVRLQLRAVELAGRPQSGLRRLRLNWYQHGIVPQAGERWQFEARLRQPRGLSNPAGFDYGAWLFSRGIDAIGYVRDSGRNRRLEPASPGNIDHWRARLGAAIDRSCADCAHRGLLKALAIGFRGDIPAPDERLLRDTGTAHLLAISGLHIGLVAGLFFGIGRGAWRLLLYRTGAGRHRVAAIVALAGAVVYAALAGFSLPTQRALVMLGCIMLGLLFRTRINLLQALSLALIVLLLLDPRAVGSVSLWLSLSAVLVIASMRFRAAGPLPWWRGLPLLQVFFMLLFLPLGALVFEQLNPAGFLANLVAIPLVGLVLLPLDLVATAGAALGLDACRWPLILADRLLEYLLRYLAWLESAGLEAIPIFRPPLWWFALLLAATILLSPLAGMWRRAALALLAGLCLWQPARLPQGGYALTVFDVGMGTSILVRTRTHSLVYDFGPGRPGRFSAADWALGPALRRYAIGTPDLLVASHVDQDHSGGFVSFRGRYSPAALVSGTPRELARRFGLPHRVRSCHDYPRWRWDGVEFSFLATGTEGNRESTNDRSCILLIDGWQDTLVPGDIEAAREMELAARHAGRLRADVLLAPHHGSATSSSWPFLRQVRPRHAVFTVSRANRWGFPRPSILQRYAAVGAKIYRSDRDGAIEILSGPEGLEISHAAAPLRRIWRRW